MNRNLILILLSFVCFGCASLHQPKIPSDGYVPDKETAIKIAEAVYKPMHGEKGFRVPCKFTTELVDGVWHVTGKPEKGFVGGESAFIRIDSRTGVILELRPAGYIAEYNEKVLKQNE